MEIVLAFKVANVEEEHARSAPRATGVKRMTFEASQASPRRQDVLAAVLCMAVVGSLPGIAAAESAVVLPDWTGAYIGFAIGAARTDGEARLTDYGGPLISLDVSNGLFPRAIMDLEAGTAGGVTIGANLQRGRFVGGVELDVAALDLDRRLSFSRIDPNPNPVFNGVETNTGYTTEFDTLAMLKLRIGLPVGQNLFYATTGLASAQVRNEFTLELPNLGSFGYASSWSEERTRYGHVTGLGVERAINESFSIKAEIVHFDLADTRVEGRDPNAFPGEALDYSFDNSGTLVRIGINLTF